MTDTKTGRERNGRIKTAQLESTLVRRDLQTLEGPTEPPAPTRVDGEFIDPRGLEE